MRFNYENLEVVSLARCLVKHVYGLTEKFPAVEKFGLIAQIRRSVLSILLNIAEGSVRGTKKDFARFVRISLGSLLETDCALKIALDLNYLSSADYEGLSPVIKELYFKLIGLDKYLSA